VGQNVKNDEGLLIPLLGIAGETGTLLAEFKKKIRDKDSYEGFQEKAEEELGDILWYLSNIASRMGLSLSEIASKNLQKTYERWPMAGDTPEMFMYFDEGYPPKEQLPRLLNVHVYESKVDKRAYMKILPDGVPLGNPLTDNAYDDDGYRFHDVMHLANLAVLGWSPVIRQLMGRKRKSKPKIDEVEDGARAIILEELVVAFVYGNARERKYYHGVKHLDSEMLSTIKRIVRHLEVSTRKTMDWEDAILSGYTVYRHLLEKKEALLQVDMKKRELTILK
jgi:NTP pyrophosphatase (non-canonical NTP hydrolase)